MKTFNWGIIGPGRIAHKFAKDLSLLPNAKLHAVASRDESKARAFAQAYDAPFAFGSYEKMLDECPDLDVVYIATPHVSHAELSKLCLNKKVAVLCEKPSAMNFEEVTSIVETAKANHTFFMEAMWSRFLPTTLKYLEIINLGTIGTIKSIQADFGFYTTFDPQNRVFNKALGGGSLLDVGIYPVFLTYLLLGKPKEIIAKAKLSSTEVDETTMAIFDYKNGQKAMIHSSTIGKTPTEGLIYGEKGMIHLHGRFHEPNRGFSLKVYDEFEQFYPFEWDSLGYKYEAQEVMQCLENKKKESDLWSWQNSLDLIEILDNIRKEIGLKY